MQLETIRMLFHESATYEPSFVSLQAPMSSAYDIWLLRVPKQRCATGFPCPLASIIDGEVSKAQFETIRMLFMNPQPMNHRS